MRRYEIATLATAGARRPGSPAWASLSGKRRSKRQIADCACVLFLVSTCLAAAGVLAQDRTGVIDRTEVTDRARHPGPGASLASLDPGPRAGVVSSGNPLFPNNPGNPIQGLTPGQVAAFQNGVSQFVETEP